MINPYPLEEVEKREIWNLLILRDLEAFAVHDWSQVREDYDEKKFMAIHAFNSANPINWNFSYPQVELYEKQWVARAKEMSRKEYTVPLKESLFRCIQLKKISFEKNKACAWKQYHGSLETKSGEKDTLHWQTLYFCTKYDSQWKISGFIGHLPLEMSETEKSLIGDL